MSALDNQMAPGFIKELFLKVHAGGYNAHLSQLIYILVIFLVTNLLNSNNFSENCMSPNMQSNGTS